VPVHHRHSQQTWHNHATQPPFAYDIFDEPSK
jgi:hypothetical protein